MTEPIIQDSYVIFPYLYKKDANDKMRIWHTYVQLFYNKQPTNISASPFLKTNWQEYNIENYTSTINTESGTENGLMVKHTTNVLSAPQHNNVLKYAIERATRKMTNKIEKEGYMIKKTEAKKKNITVGKLYPMLLQEYQSSKHAKLLSSGAYVQPKFDGVRCLAKFIPDEKLCILSSRSGQNYKNPISIREQLTKLFDILSSSTPLKKTDFVFDGELHIPGKTSEYVAGAMNAKYITGEHEAVYNQMMFTVFDIIILPHITEFDFQKRQEILQILFDKFDSTDSQIELSKVHYVTSEKEVFHLLHDVYEPAGYEGIVIRFINRTYELGKRSSAVLKLKSFLELEFPVVGFKEGKGVKEGSIIWILKAKNGKEFAATPIGSISYTKKLYEQAQKDFTKFNGRLMTVKFKGYTSKGVPYHANALGFYDERH
jgi:ATP-dependent DNA ligase